MSEELKRAVSGKLSRKSLGKGVGERSKRPERRGVLRDGSFLSSSSLVQHGQGSVGEAGPYSPQAGVGTGTEVGPVFQTPMRVKWDHI